MLRQREELTVLRPRDVHLVELRCPLEAAAVRLAVRRPDAGTLASARGALEQMRAADGDLIGIERADVSFHVALVQASGNRVLELVMLAVRDSIEAHLLTHSPRNPTCVRTRGAS